MGVFQPSGGHEKKRGLETDAVVRVVLIVHQDVVGKDPFISAGNVAKQNRHWVRVALLGMSDDTSKQLASLPTSAGMVSAYLLRQCRADCSNVDWSLFAPYAE
jgi:hypothetical protein